ncbi:MAG: leucine-rich repeat protein [Chitinispirillales bacterium]|jgi:hypothetical protein|nr:leucine-rich repeat protein [Chitinispirillales bacterium]
MAVSEKAAQAWDCGRIPGTVKAEFHGGTLTISGEGKMRDYSTSAYNAPWYGFRSSITEVIIEKGVASITSETFWGCTGLTSIDIPYSVLDIGPGAFLGCTGLTSINVAPENIYYRSVNGVLFYVKDSAYSLVQYPAGKRGASYAVPSGVTAIERWAFYGCAHLMTVSIPNSVMSINRSFVGCNSLVSIEVSSGNAYFRSVDGVLFYATGDKEEYVLLTYPASKRGPYAVPDGVTRLREKAFLDCVGLSSITLPNSVMFIENYAFSGCTGLTSITIPRSVMSIEDWVFSGCAGLTSIDVSPENSGFRSIDGVLFRTFYKKEELMAYPAGRQGAYTIPDCVTSIESMTFFNCTGLTSVVIPDSVTYIGGWAFMECYGLTSVAIGKGVTSIGRGAFMHCHDLASVISLSVIPPAIEQNKYGIFDVFDAENTACLYVPKELLAIYRTTEGWKEFAGIKSIAEYAPAPPSDHTVSREKPLEDATSAALASALSGGGFTVGPNASVGPSGAVSFFRHGSRIESAKLYIYDLSGDVVKKVKIGDHSGGAEPSSAPAKPGRPVGSWDLRDVKGRPVSGGTYLVKGELKMSGGKREQVSVVVDVR